MQVTVADDLRGRPGRVIGQPAGGADQVRAPELIREPRQHRDQPGHGHRHLPDLLELAAHEVGVEGMQPGHRSGEPLGDLAEQTPQGGRGRHAVQPGQGRPSEGSVHDH